MTSRYLPYWATLAIVVATALILLWMGRVPYCTCGYVKLLHLETMSSENSQHMFDWYTPSHVLHGFIFYFLLWLVARRIDIGWRLAIATLIEAAWEIVENTDAIINRYREVTIALDYYGDSVLNSVFDILAMFFGFWLARRVPVWVSLAIIVIAEFVVIASIRDGLALNILMLLYPLESVKEWQNAF
ncbi:uncharacterized protein DUF2585 [Litoreibacter ponti]|uniref:Uncharacterized protein DUF2585 n=1 Tax=Litoreibacter ponti TaxID=1510457 RepID=A0A2T6BPD8_9RHOB|nr:DUF2585 domain-containing protein [Litoreibacter ponti]PTX57837.1 uncharacterized protein DUF2585 [Litoreibacter ponti]